MLKKYVILFIINMNLINANSVYIQVDSNSTKIILPNITVSTCDIIIGDSLKNINDKVQRFGYISQEKLTLIPAVDGSQKLYFFSEDNTTNIFGYLPILTANDFFNKKIIFPSKNICYQELFNKKKKYFYTRSLQSWDNQSFQRIVNNIDDIFAYSIDTKLKQRPSFYVILLKDKNKNSVFYPFFTLNSINSTLWKMHKEKQYMNFYKILLKKFEKKVKDINHLDTLAWVYADNNNSQKALEIYEKRILPFIKDNNSDVFKENYKILKEKVK